MKIFIGPQGGISWDITQQAFRHNFEHFNKMIGGVATPPHNFSSKWSWHTFACKGGCERILPVDIADVDHIKPKSKFTWKIIMQSTVSMGDCFKVYTTIDGGAEWIITDQGAIYCYATSTSGEVNKDVWVRYDININNPNQITVFFDEFNETKYPLQKLLENEVSNLQLLCPRCNRSKGAKITV